VKQIQPVADILQFDVVALLVASGREYATFWSIVQDLFDYVPESVNIFHSYGSKYSCYAPSRGRTHG
jgi:hypothetical protein